MKKHNIYKIVRNALIAANIMCAIAIIVMSIIIMPAPVKVV